VSEIVFFLLFLTHLEGRFMCEILAKKSIFGKNKIEVNGMAQHIPIEFLGNAHHGVFTRSSYMFF